MALRRLVEAVSIFFIAKGPIHIFCFYPLSEVHDADRYKGRRSESDCGNSADPNIAAPIIYLPPI
jgi:hypothetical protein